MIEKYLNELILCYQKKKQIVFVALKRTIHIRSKYLTWVHNIILFIM